MPRDSKASLSDSHLLRLPVKNTGNSSYLEKEKTNKFFSSVEKCVLRTYESGKVLHVWREQEKKHREAPPGGPMLVANADDRFSQYLLSSFHSAKEHIFINIL